MADSKANTQLQTMVANALVGVPSFLKSGLDDNLSVVQATPQKGYSGHSAIASVDDDSPNTIRIHDADLLAKASPAQRTALLAHELTHRQMDQSAPTIRFKPVDPTAPYDYDENNLAGKKITDFSGEQLAKMVETNTAYQNDPSISAARKAQVAALYTPIIKQLSQLPQATINTQQPDNSMQINPTANPPAGVSFDDSPLVTPAETGPTTPASDWEDLPSQGSGVQSSDSDWEDVKPEESIGSKAMGWVASQGLPIAGAVVGGALGSVEPGPGTIAGAALGGMAGNELNTALRGASGQSADTGAKRVAGDLEAGAGGAFFGRIEKGTHALTTAIADSTLPGRSVNALHTDIESVARRAASDAGVEVKPTDNVRKIISNTADAVRQKAQEKLDAIDDVYEGLKFNARGAAGKFTSGTSADLGLPEKFSGYDEQLQKLSEKLHSMPGADNIEKRAALQKQIQALTSAKAQAANALDKQGLAGAREEATRLLQQADELDNLKAAHNRANFGPPGREAKTNPIKFQREIQPLHESGQLHTALGSEHAEDLMDAADRSARTFRRATAATTVAKTVGKVAARGAAEGVGAGTAYRTIENLTK